MVEPRKEDPIDKISCEDKLNESDEVCVVVANEHSSDDEEFDLVAQMAEVLKREEEERRRQIDSEVFGGDVVRKTRMDGEDDEPWITSLKQIQAKKRNSNAINSRAGAGKDHSASRLTN